MYFVFYIDKTKRRLHDRKTEHLKALAKNDNTSAIADHVKTTGLNIKWNHFDILAKGKTDHHCKIKETFFFIFQFQRRKRKADAVSIYSSFMSLLLSIICLI